MVKQEVGKRRDPKKETSRRCCAGRGFDSSLLAESYIAGIMALVPCHLHVVDTHMTMYSTDMYVSTRSETQGPPRTLIM